MNEIVYQPLSGESLHIWDQSCLIKYKNLYFGLKYETEPPFGDFIYSIKIMENDNDAYYFPYWIYGRNLLFYNEYVIMEGLEANNGYHNPLHTIIINIELLQYAMINEWYSRFSVDNERLILENRHTKESIILRCPIKQLTWYAINGPAPL